MEDIKRTDVWQKKLVIIQISEYNRIYDWRNTMNYLTTIEMSKKWGITSRRIAILCEQGRIKFIATPKRMQKFSTTECELLCHRFSSYPGTL